MQSDPHQRARFLIDEALIAGIARDDDVWLRSHSAECAECANYAETTSRIVRGLNALSFETDPAMTARVRDALAACAQRRPSAAQRYSAMQRRYSAPPWRWGLIAAALLIAVAAPVYRNMTDRRREAEIDRADTLLLQRVNARVSQTLPSAMEPLVQTQTTPGRDR
jgi:hypothetical protein